MDQGADPTGTGKRLRGPENRETFLEARMANVLDSPRVRLVLPQEALELLLELARRVDMNRAGLVSLAAAVEGLIGQRPQPPVGQNRPLDRDG